MSVIKSDDHDKFKNVKSIYDRCKKYAAVQRALEKDNCGTCSDVIQWRHLSAAQCLGTKIDSAMHINLV